MEWDGRIDYELRSVELLGSLGGFVSPRLFTARRYVSSLVSTSACVDTSPLSHLKKHVCTTLHHETKGKFKCFLHNPGYPASTYNLVN